MPEFQDPRNVGLPRDVRVSSDIPARASGLLPTFPSACRASHPHPDCAPFAPPVCVRERCLFSSPLSSVFETRRPLSLEPAPLCGAPVSRHPHGRLFLQTQGDIWEALLGLTRPSNRTGRGARLRLGGGQEKGEGTLTEARTERGRCPVVKTEFRSRK